MTATIVLLFASGTSHDASLPLTLLLVFGSAKLFSEIFERLRLPGIVGEILAGVLIGPSVLGLIQPTELVTALAELGVMFLLFGVGMEVKASELMQSGRTALTVAMLGVILPFAAGWGLSSAWGHTRIEGMFIGASMVATSVGITAQVLSAKGLLRHRTSQIILAAAIIDDVLGLIVLAVVSSLAQGGVNVTALATTALVAILFTIVIARWGTRAMKAIVPRVEENLNAAEAQFAMAMCLLFGLSLLAVYAGVAAIIGAFLAGMALSETVSSRVHTLTAGVTELLVPFFLVGIGLHFNLSAFSNLSTLLFGLVILAAAAASKLIGCGLGAWSTGRADAFRIGCGMIPRGEVGMVVAQIGLSLGTVSEAVFGVVVFMSVMTTVIAPPLLAYAYRDVPPSNT